jgi:uncharacterized protein (TIGR00369 family)
MMERIEHILSNANEEEVEVLELVVDAIEQYKSDSKHTLLANTLKMKPTMKEDGTCHCTIPITKLVKNFINTVHGGITATLVDTTMGRLVVNGLLPNESTVTTELKFNYLRPGVGKFLTCVASTIHRGKRLHICEGKVYNDKDELILHATGSFFILKNKTKGGE